MLRASSPAMSEISVGSPSPPPLHTSPTSRHGLNAVNIKRLRSSVDIMSPQSPVIPPPVLVPQRRKSSAERVKSFSIADILGKKEQEAANSPLAEKISISKKCETTLQTKLGPPSTQLANSLANQMVPHHLLAERLQAPPPLNGPPPFFMLDLPTLHKAMPTSWDQASASNNSPASLPLHHFFPPALLHYEQRLAWDYQRQLQEHFQAQAQLLRQMSMDPNIIPSEDGSERSRSSSTGSQCYSPDVNVAGDVDIEKDDIDGNDPPVPGGRSSLKKESSTKNVDEKSRRNANDTPLDALFQLSTKNFDEDQDPATLNIFATRPNPKKKRKSRTAFTNHQIFELEKRFLYQKYLSPADRDEIASGLGLSNAQVITWFQNRRAKLKRDMEELKKDVESVKQLSAHKSFLENVNDLSILKTRPVSRSQQPSAALLQHPLPEVHTATHTYGQHTTEMFSTTSAGRLPPLPAATSGSTNPTIQMLQQHHQHQHQHQHQRQHQHQHQHKQLSITVPTSTCNESRTESNGRNENALQQTEQQNAQHNTQQPQPSRNLQSNHTRG